MPRSPVQAESGGRYIVVDGKRWRATDPSIPDTLKAELVAELMSGRRAVRAGEADARDRVQDAKVALGERGRPWWDEPDEGALDSRIRSTVLALLRHRDGTSICPSDVARTVGGASWRRWLDAVRRQVDVLAAADRVVVTQRGEAVRASGAKGPIRISKGTSFDGS